MAQLIKAPASKPDHQNPVSGTHKVEGDNQLL